MLESYGFIMFSYAMSWYESAISLPLMDPRFIWIYHIPRIRIHRFSSSPVIFPPDLPWLFSRAGRCRVWAGHRDVPGLRKKAGVDIQVNHGKYHMGYHRRQYSNKGDPGKSTYPKWWYGFFISFHDGISSWLCQKYWDFMWDIWDIPWAIMWDIRVCFVMRCHHGIP